MNTTLLLYVFRSEIVVAHVAHGHKSLEVVKQFSSLDTSLHAHVLLCTVMYTHAHTHTRTNTRTHAHKSNILRCSCATHTRWCSSSFTHTYIHTRAHTRTLSLAAPVTRRQGGVLQHVYTHIHLHTRTHTRTRTQKHTHTHTDIRTQKQHPPLLLCHADKVVYSKSIAIISMIFQAVMAFVAAIATMWQVSRGRPYIGCVESAHVLLPCLRVNLTKLHKATKLPRFYSHVTDERGNARGASLMRLINGLCVSHFACVLCVCAHVVWAM